MQLILASRSPARRRLLKRLGYKFKCEPADLDEAKVARKIRDPRRLVRELARLKAFAIAGRHPRAIVIGSDQVLVCAGRIFGKPGTEARARTQLRAMSGRKVYLFASFCIIEKGREVALAVHRTALHVRVLSSREIADYVKTDAPLECAGSFKFECSGIALFESVETDDPSAIEGLPLIHLARELRRL